MSSNLADLQAALDSAHTCMALSSNDWGTARDFAWLYGILVGWDADSDDEDDIHAMNEPAAKFGWSDEDVARLRRYRAAVAGFDLTAVLELQRLREVLAELVRLKDGPRDDGYERDKPMAWATARALLGMVSP